MPQLMPLAARRALRKQRGRSASPLKQTFMSSNPSTLPAATAAGSPDAPKSAGKKRKAEAAPGGMLSQRQAEAAREQQAEAAAAKIVQFFASQPEGGLVRQEVLEQQVGATMGEHVFGAGLNKLMGEGRLVASQRANMKLSFKLQSKEEAQRLNGLTAEDRLVLQEVERAATAGIATKDLKARTNLQTAALQRVLKKLEAKRLVQSHKSVASKNKKMYLLAGLEPTREITGGSWYSGAEFDHEFISQLAKSALAYIQKKEKATAAEVHAFICESGLVRGKQLRLEDVDSVLQTLVYDARAEITKDPRSGKDAVYRVVHRLSSIESRVDALMSLPPADCEHYDEAMSAWLEAAVAKPPQQQQATRQSSNRVEISVL